MSESDNVLRLPMAMPQKAIDALDTLAAAARAGEVSGYAIAYTRPDGLAAVMQCIPSHRPTIHSELKTALDWLSSRILSRVAFDDR